ncbi:MAG: hypothetical protein KatS3mg043_2173 [Rhodothermaceae bacterium]|nr:MAG: hypothetical protein KatS3mg043_2173 [Rhodothermaceae bacterium]
MPQCAGRVTPPDTLSALYREAALLLLMPEDEAAGRWQRIARAPVLDPALARLLVDTAFRTQDNARLEAFRALWQQRQAETPEAPGPLFGLGYLAVLRAAWEEAEPLLQRATELAPDDPEAYRELGRLYFHTARPEALVQALENGIRAARARYDLRTELILRGNLGLTLMEQQGNLAGAEQMFQTALEQSRTLADRASEGFNLYRPGPRPYPATALSGSPAPAPARRLALCPAHPPASGPRCWSRSEPPSTASTASADAEAVLETAVAEAETPSPPRRPAPGPDGPGPPPLPDGSLHHGPANPPSTYST